MFYLLSLIPLSSMIYTDFAKRWVSLRMLVVFTSIQLYVALLSSGAEIVLFRLVMNNSLITLLTLCVVFYLKCRNKTWKNYIGVGDLFFVIALTPAFDLFDFQVFLLIAFALTLLGYVIVSCFQQKYKTIPLVSCIGFIYVLYLLQQSIYG